MPALPTSFAAASAHGAHFYERYGRALPPLAAALLVAGIAWTLAGLIWALIPAPESAVWKPAPAQVSSTARRGGLNVESIISAQLFGQYQAAARPSANLGSAPDTNLSLTLLGILAGRSERDSRALISSSSGTEDSYAIGDDIASGVTLHAIFPDRVILARNGNYETLRLDKDSPSQATAAPVVQQPAADNTTQMLSQIREQVLQDPTKAGDYIRVQPANQGGSLQGYRVYPGRNRDMFTNLGLRPGDLVTAVNGITLDDGQKALQTLNELKQASNVTLTIERGGQQQTVNVSLN